MTQAEARTRRDQLLSLSNLNRDGTAPTEAQDVVQINQAIRYIAREVPLWDPTIAFTMSANVMEYSLLDTGIVARRIKRPAWLKIDTRTLRRPDGKPGFWTRDEFVAQYPDWQNQSAGEVRLAVWNGTDVLIWPKPDATEAALTASFAAEYWPADVTTSDDSNQLPLPEELHDCVPYLMAHEAGLAFVTEDFDWKRLQVFYDKAHEYLQRFKRAQKNAAFGGQGSRVFADYVPNGGSAWTVPR